jgi:Asp-tRNA(Asn)/Glu-tRNA(Gln) amidotransferase A subunit family amidase
MSIADLYERADATELAERIRRKEVSAAEVLGEARRRAEALQPRINCFTETWFDDAARELARGLPAGPFRGVPFAIKDLGCDVAGRATRNGSRLFREAAPAERDAELTARYRRAGLLLVGKTATPEFGLNTSTEPLANGPTRNPWNLARIAGGSSGGAAAAVAARIFPVAHATDGGGSIRIPASCCGLFGLKPTRGRTPQGPRLGERWSGLSIGHVVSRSVRDSAALLDAVTGAAPGDPYCAPHQARPFLAELDQRPQRLRVAFTREAATGTPVEPECVRAVEATARLCEELGHEVREAAPRYDAMQLGNAMRVIISASLANMVGSREQLLGRAAREDELEGVTRAFVAMGRAAKAPDYVAALDAIHAMGRQLAAFFESCDVWLSPTVSQLPVELGVLDMNAELARYGAAAGRFTPFTGLFNATGQPAMSVPLHVSPAGLPVGVQFAARFGDDALLLRLAAQLEAARPWAARRPALVA